MNSVRSRGEICSYTFKLKKLWRWVSPDYQTSATCCRLKLSFGFSGQVRNRFTAKFTQSFFLMKKSSTTGLKLFENCYFSVFLIVIVISILLALYLLDNPGFVTKFRKENCSGQINNPNELTLMSLSWPIRKSLTQALIQVKPMGLLVMWIACWATMKSRCGNGWWRVEKRELYQWVVNFSREKSSLRRSSLVL